MDERPTPFERLNIIEKAGYLGAAFFDVAERIGNTVLEEVSRVASDAIDAFSDELDPNIEDAKILDETDDRPRPSGKQ